MSFNVTKQMVNAEVTQFYQEYPRSDITIDTVVTDNILDRRLSLACGPNDFQRYRDRADLLREFNGTIAFGKTITDTHYVLLASDKLCVDEYTWHGTVYHEYTHIYDNIDFANYNSIKIMDDIYSAPYYDQFSLWTEFHARYTGMKRTQTVRYPADIADYMRTDAPKLCNEMIKTYTANQNPYEFMQFVGRYLFLEECSPSFVPSFSSLLKRNSSINSPSPLIKLYRFLRNHKTADQALADLPQFKSLLLDVKQTYFFS